MAAGWERGDDEPARLCRDSIRPGAQRPGSSEGGRGTGHSPAQGGRCGAAAATEEPRPVDLPTSYATAVSPAQPIRSSQRAFAGRRAIGGAGAEGNRPTGGRGGPLARTLPQPPPRRGDCWPCTGRGLRRGLPSRWTGAGLSAAAVSEASEDGAVKGRATATPTSIAQRVTIRQSGMAGDVPPVDFGQRTRQFSANLYPVRLTPSRPPLVKSQAMPPF
jgi:hypothetical protein